MKVARPASVYVRSLSEEEAVKLRRISRQSKVFALRQRAQIILASDARSAAAEIARVLGTDENQVRRVIREFNEKGMESLHHDGLRERAPPPGRCGASHVDDCRDARLTLLVTAVLSEYVGSVPP